MSPEIKKKSSPLKVSYLLIPLAAEFMILMVSDYLSSSRGALGPVLALFTFVILILMGAYMIYDRVKSLK